MRKMVVFQRFMAVLVIFVTILAAAIFTLDYTAAEPDVPEEQQIVATPIYIVKSDGNKVGVYQGASETPEYYIDVLVNSLPEYDQALLSVGIEIYTEEELTQITEDLES